MVAQGPNQYPEGLPDARKILSQLQAVAEDGRGALQENTARSLHWALPQEEAMMQASAAQAQPLRDRAPSSPRVPPSARGVGMGPLGGHPSWQTFPLKIGSRVLGHVGVRHCGVGLVVGREGQAQLCVPRLPSLEACGRRQHWLEIDPRAMRSWAMTLLAITLGLPPLQPEERARLPMVRIHDVLHDGETPEDGLRRSGAPFPSHAAIKVGLTFRAGACTWNLSSPTCRLSCPPCKASGWPATAARTVFAMRTLWLEWYLMRLTQILSPRVTGRRQRQSCGPFLRAVSITISRTGQRSPAFDFTLVSAGGRDPCLLQAVSCRVVPVFSMALAGGGSVLLRANSTAPTITKPPFRSWSGTGSLLTSTLLSLCDGLGKLPRWRRFPYSTTISGTLQTW